MTVLSIRIGKGKSHKRWFLRGRIFKRRECLIIIFLFVRKLFKPGHGSTFLPRNQWKVGGRREETWKIQSASRSKRYANERVPPEAGRTTSVTIATTTTSSVFLSFPVNTVRSGCFFLRCSSGNLFTRVSALSPNNISLLYFNSPFAFFPTPTRRVSLVFILGIF